ncbi:MAG: KOW domain-containing RNA-binding protein [Defluviitaleaceae bacterium]|nr:KOW domain-containing RNA-binding protein [Defluviitaleaceae bacterium]
MKQKKVRQSELKIGQIVFSKAGRDKSDCFVVIATEGEFAQLVDGKTRPLERPKKKKRMHIQHTNFVDELLAQAIVSGAHLKNSDFKTAIKNATSGYNEINENSETEASADLLHSNPSDQEDGRCICPHFGQIHREDEGEKDCDWS